MGLVAYRESRSDTAEVSGSCAIEDYEREGISGCRNKTAEQGDRKVSSVIHVSTTIHSIIASRVLEFEVECRGALELAISGNVYSSRGITDIHGGIDIEVGIEHAISSEGSRS